MVVGFAVFVTVTEAVIVTTAGVDVDVSVAVAVAVVVANDVPEATIVEVEAVLTIIGS